MQLQVADLKFFLFLTAMLNLACMDTATGAETSDQFVGSAGCVECHQQQYSNWKQSDHHKAMQPATSDTVLGDFNDVTVNFHNIETRFFREAEVFKVETAGVEGKSGVFTIAYTFGHYPLQQYLIDIGDGHLQALNIAWDSRSKTEGGQRWYHLQTDEDIDPDHPFFWTRHFQNSNSRCIVCHSSNVSKNYSPESKSYVTTWSETGVGCESCHGPAATHISLAQDNQFSSENKGFTQPQSSTLAWSFKGNDDIASANGKRDESYINTCGGCHSRRSSNSDITLFADYHDQYRLSLLDEGLYFADGQIEDEVFVLGSFLQSKMHASGVTCANCHNAHSGKLIAEGNTLCAQCHKPAVFDNDEHHHHKQDSSGAQCVNCHMPKRLYMTVDARRDHSFAIPDPALSAGTGAPNVCTGCHQAKTDQWAATALNNWGIVDRENFWPLINQGLDRQDSLIFKDYARYATEINLPPIREASLLAKLAAFPSQLAVDSAARQLSNPDPLMRRAAVTSLRSMPAQLRWQLLNPLIEDPNKIVRLEVAGALADILPQLNETDAGRLNSLIDEYRSALNYNADSPAGQLSIGNLEASLGFSILAENAYLRSLEIEPAYVPSLINLADLYRSSGRDHESQKILQQALRIAPDSANANHAYALYLIRAGKQQQALSYLETSISLEDATPRHIYVYAVALDSRGETDKAIQVINQASKRWRNNLELSFLQVSYMDKTGNTGGIHRYLTLLASVASKVPQVQQWMKKYGARPKS